MKNLFNILSSRKGFTLVELLLVISVIGLLASIVLVNLGGTRDQARIANVLRTQAQIHRLLGADLVGWWNFDDVALTPIPNLSGGGNIGTCDTVAGTCPSVSEDIVPGTRGRARSFDGENDFINVSNYSSLQLVSAGTVGVWVLFTLFEESTGIIGKTYSPGWNVTDYGIVHRGGWAGTGNLRGTITNGTNYNDIGGPALSLNRWYHVVFSWNGSALQLYYNGVQVALPVPQTITPRVSNNSLRIGTWGSLSSSMTGRIDDVRIYHRALTASEVQTLYAQTKDKYLAENK